MLFTADLRTSYCYCGGNYGSASWTSEADCTQYCAGDTNQKCGYGTNRYSVFEVGSEDCDLRGKLCNGIYSHERNKDQGWNQNNGSTNPNPLSGKSIM